MSDSRSRKWLITINNPLDKGLDHDAIKQKITQLSGVIYWCMSDEIAASGTPHTHLFVADENAIRFSTLKRKFEGARLDMSKGTSAENRDYVFKQGKWTNDRKRGTNLGNTHHEYGEIPAERQGARNDLADLYAMIKEGADTADILETNPEYMTRIDQIERTRQILREKQYREEFRRLEISYTFGATNLNKTRDILERYGYANVYRVTDYEHPFDGYRGQDVLCFDEFRSSLKIQDMLLYLEGYPCELKARYANKVACYTVVHIVSNIELKQQYPEIQNSAALTWQAFLRRIGKVVHYASKREIHIGTVQDYYHGFPFEQMRTTRDAYKDTLQHLQTRKDDIL